MQALLLDRGPMKIEYMCRKSNNFRSVGQTLTIETSSAQKFRPSNSNTYRDARRCVDFGRKLGHSRKSQPNGETTQFGLLKI